MVLTLKAVNYDHEEIVRMKRLLPGVIFSSLVRRLLTEHLDKVESDQLKEQIKSMTGESPDIDLNQNNDPDPDNDPDHEPTTADQENTQS